MTALANPNLALLLLLAGIFLIYWEFNRPGTIILGCLGALAVMLGIHGLTLHPLSPAAIVLSLAAVASIAIGCAYPLRGATSAAGTIALIFGLENLFVTPRLSSVTAIATATIFSLVTTWLGRVAMRARRNKQIPGPWDQPTPPQSRLVRRNTFSR